MVTIPEAPTSSHVFLLLVARSRDNGAENMGFLQELPRVIQISQQKQMIQISWALKPVS